MLHNRLWSANPTQSNRSGFADPLRGWSILLSHNQVVYQIQNFILQPVVKSSPGDRELFLVFRFHSRWLQRLSNLDITIALTSRSFPIPFCTSRTLYCPMPIPWCLK
ncbi:hypothetical protein ACB094_11G159100 [Castanea mollissima]